MRTTASELKRHLELADVSIRDLEDQKKKLVHRKNSLEVEQVGIQDQIFQLNAQLESLAGRLMDVGQQITQTQGSIDHFLDMKGSIERRIEFVEMNSRGLSEAKEAM